jgi:hypothetical protein
LGKLIVPKEFLGAFKRGHRADSKDLIDDELATKLLRKAEEGCEESRATLIWLTKFNNEFHKNVCKKGDRTTVHNTAKLRHDCRVARADRRRRDMFNVFKRVDCSIEWAEEKFGSTRFLKPKS